MSLPILPYNPLSPAQALSMIDEQNARSAAVQQQIINAPMQIAEQLRQQKFQQEHEDRIARADEIRQQFDAAKELREQGLVNSQISENAAQTSLYGARQKAVESGVDSTNEADQAQRDYLQSIANGGEPNEGGAVGKVTDYGQGDDPYLDSNTAKGLNAMGGQLTPASMALSRDLEGQLNAKGLHLGDNVAVTLGDGSQVIRKFDDRTSDKLRGRVDLYSPDGPSPLRDKAVVSLDPAAALRGPAETPAAAALNLPAMAAQSPPSLSATDAAQLLRMPYPQRTRVMGQILVNHARATGRTVPSGGEEVAQDPETQRIIALPFDETGAHRDEKTGARYSVSKTPNGFHVRELVSQPVKPSFHEVKGKGWVDLNTKEVIIPEEANLSDATVKSVLPDYTALQQARSELLAVIKKEGATDEDRASASAAFDSANLKMKAWLQLYPGLAARVGAPPKQGEAAAVNPASTSPSPSPTPDAPVATAPKALGAETAKALLQQAGGDKDKARAMAKQQGYSF